MAILEVDHLSITDKQRGRKLTHEVSFSINEGDAFGIIGESGSGKTMTSKCIMRLLNQRTFKYEGKVRWRGEEVLNMKAKRLSEYRGKQVGMIAQNPMTAFAPGLRIGKQMELGFNLHGQKEKTAFYEGIKETFKLMNLYEADSILHAYPDEVSGGMLQRIMIALILLKKPDLLIADEVTTAVDSISEYLILEQLKKLKASGMSMLVITHDFAVAATLCKRVAVMKDGRIIEAGPTHQILCQPQQEYTKKLVQASVLYEGENVKSS